MHEVSLGAVLTDYLSGDQIEETTYEEFRQALARLLVEEKKFPKDRIQAKIDFNYEVEGEKHARQMDFIVTDDSGKVLLVILFCAGEVGSYERETALLGQLMPNGPSPLALVTNTKEASLMNSETGNVLAKGMQAIPSWDDLKLMVDEIGRKPVAEDRREKLLRIFHAYSGFVTGTCCNESCS